MAARHSALGGHVGAGPGRAWAWALGGVMLGVLGALLLFAPAAWVARALSVSTDGQLWLHDTRGTWWQGSARLALASGAGGSDRMRLPGQVRWRLLPGWADANDPGLQGPLLRLQISADCCTSEPLRVDAGMTGLSARVRLLASASRWPASLLVGLGTPWNTLEPDGLVHLVAQEAAVVTVARGRWSLQGVLALEARDISSRLSTLRPMGSYRLELRGGEVPAVALQTLEPSSLRLKGRGQWVGDRLRFQGSASAAEGRIDALSNLLNIIGRRDGARSIIQLG